MRLPQSLIEAGDELLRFGSIDTTMDEARRRYRVGARHRLWIVADRQEAGRGRGGRPWASPVGNLHMTLLTPTAIALREQPKLGFAAGVALAEAAEALLPPVVEVRLKWPNDLLLDGGKASGILLEGHGGGAAVAIGIGVNVTAHPPDVSYAASHLRMFDDAVDRDVLFAKLAVRLVESVRSFEGEGFAPTRERWLRRAAHLGRMVEVRGHRGPQRGRFLDLDAEGCLLLEFDGGVTPIEAGDVFPLDKADGKGQGPASATIDHRAT
jgi:BirA family transcriptional regulator, biotin operon repressor / biotin---[acetyl-CoA-carboxylase] ligase